jgi:hypothetical protein
LQKYLAIRAVINANNVYAKVAIKNNSSKAANVTTRNIAKIKLATAIGLFNNFSNIYDIMITAIGKAKKINKRFII